MRYATAAGIVLAAALAVSAGERRGGEGPKGGTGPEGGQGGLWKELGLTQQQREQLRGLRQDQVDPNKDFRGRMQEIRKATKEEFSKADPSKSALDKLAGQLGDLAEDLAKEKAEYLLEVKKVLTVDQWAKLLERNWMLDLGPGPGPGGGPRGKVMMMKGKGKGKEMEHGEEECPMHKEHHGGNDDED